MTRLVGLLVDRHFGLAAWSPVYLLAVPALAALVRRRPAGWTIVALPSLAGWLNATFVAQTMHGWWSPGRQVVVVLPLVVLAVAWWCGLLARRMTWTPAAVAALGLVGAFNWAWLNWEVLDLRRTVIVDFWETEAPAYRLWSALLPDGGLLGFDPAGFAVWTAALLVLAALGWWSVADAPALHAPSAPLVRDLVTMEGRTT